MTFIHIGVLCPSPTNHLKPRDECTMYIENPVLGRLCNYTYCSLSIVCQFIILDFFLSLMGSIFSLLSPTRKACWDKIPLRTRDRDSGRPFLEMIRDHSHYGSWIKAQATYEIKLVHRNSALHWYLLLRIKGSSTLPYISIEITTSDMNDLTPVTRNFEIYDADQVSELGIYEGTLYHLCQLADGVVKEMGSYDLVSSNCQTFCNKLLKQIGKNEFPTSLESELIDIEFDLLSKVVQKEPVPTTVVESVMGDSVNEPEFAISDEIPPPTISDLKAIHKILMPVQHKWMEIGIKFMIQNLDKIKETYGGIANQCLREMLREYLQRSDPGPLWVDLAEAVKEYNYSIAVSIIKEAEKKGAD